MLPDVTTGAAGGGRFQTTRWSLILASLGGGPEESKAREALGQLCRTYWRPVYAFIWRRGYSIADAQDLTQDFFLMILKGNLLQQANPERGRFRSLLLRKLEHFLIDSRGRAETQKRGGDIEFVNWDEWMAEAPSRLTISTAALESWPAERVFDVRWAATVAEQALRHLQEECESRGRRRVFKTLSEFLTADRNDVCYDALARELGVSPADVKGALHRLRQRYRRLLRKEVAATIEDPAEIDAELRYLVSALATREKGS